MARAPRVTFESFLCVLEFGGGSGSAGEIPGHKISALRWAKPRVLKTDAFRNARLKNASVSKKCIGRQRVGAF